MRSFGEWLSLTRTKPGMSQAELARVIGANYSYISRLESGDLLTKEGIPGRPSVAFVDAMAQALGVSCAEARLAATYAPPDRLPRVTFGKWLRKTRLKVGMTQETLAHNTGVTGAYISLLELGKASKQGTPIRPSLHLVDAIAGILGVACKEARLAAGYAPTKTGPAQAKSAGNVP